MSVKTSNYGAARGVLGLAEIVLWAGVAVGIILALAAAGAVSNSFGRPGAGFAAAMPGVAISVVSFVGVVLIQMAKATVDTADYTYQMLAVARDQLSVSKQGLAKEKPAQSFSERLVVAPPSAPSLRSRDTSIQATNEAEHGASFAGAKRSERLDWDYRGKRINRTEHGYLVEGETFVSLEQAKLHVDHVHDTKIEKRGGQYWVGGQNFLKLENAQAYADEQGK